MKKIITYELTYSYGIYLAKTKRYNTYKEAYKAAKWYKHYYKDVCKWYTITKVTTTKRLLHKNTTVHKMNEWSSDKVCKA